MDKTHLETIKLICQEAGIEVEERPKQKWGTNYKLGAVEYQVLRLGGNRCDFLFSEDGKMVAISQ
jgi:hypothetical protein